MSPAVAEDTEKAKADAIKARNAAMAEREKKLNVGKTGVGTRSFLGMTRGRNPQEIQYENWDESIPDSLPKTFDDVLKVHADRGETDKAAEQAIVRRWILGDNDMLYADASDPISEFVDKTWPEDVQKQFRLVVRNYCAATNTSIDDAVALIRPGIVASQKVAK